jgi:hypothetical protein
MWLAPYTFGSKHEIEITLDHPASIAGLRVWNYNKNSSTNEEVYRGVRSVKIHCDDKILGIWVLSN